MQGVSAQPTVSSPGAREIPITKYTASQLKIACTRGLKATSNKLRYRRKKFQDMLP